MDHKKICDTCIYYYAYGLTNGTCMQYFLLKKSRKDKDVSYVDTCEEWTCNDNLIAHKNIRFNYEELKKEYALQNLKRVKQKSC
jgi:hypothetical protein